MEKSQWAARCANVPFLLRPAGLVSILAVLLTVPTVVAAAETDRLTVEDPVTNAVKFRLTSEGNVTGGIFSGDGSGLANVAHFKGAWNSATTYLKDDCVSYNGSTYIAVAGSTAAQPDVTPASWTIFAAKGADGQQGLQGDKGDKGDKGDTGLQGPAGSPDTQAQILSKIATQADGALTVQQGATEAVGAPKIAVKDSTGATKFAVQSNGALAIGTGTATYPFTLDTSIATAVPAGVGTFVLEGSSNKERIELRSHGANANDTNCVIQGKAYRMINGVPANTVANQTLFSFGGSGHDGSNVVISNKIFIDFRAAEDWSPLKQGTYMIVQTTNPGTTTRTEKFRITGDGNIGIGIPAPTQKLELDGGVRLNTITTRPPCDANSRGTFWFTKGAATADDSVAVCSQIGGVMVWKTLY